MFIEAKDEQLSNALLPILATPSGMLIEDKDEQFSNSIDLIIVVDATDYAFGCNHLLMVKTDKKMIIPTTDKTRLQRKTYLVIDSTEKMKPFMRNLKGLHTSWQS